MSVYPGLTGSEDTDDRSSAFVVTDVGVTHIWGERIGLEKKAMEIAQVYDSKGSTMFKRFCSKESIRRFLCEVAGMVEKTRDQTIL